MNEASNEKDVLLTPYFTDILATEQSWSIAKT